jgi:hypothetical protein
MNSFRWIIASLSARMIASVAGLVLALVASPEAFGIYGRVVLAILVCGVVVFLRFDRAVISEATEEKAMAASSVALRGALVTVSLCLAAIWLLIPELRMQDQPGLVLFSLAASLLCKSALLLAFAWLQRLGLGLVLAAAMTVQALVQISVQMLLLILSPYPVVAMLAGDALGAAAGLVIAARRLPDLRRALAGHGAIWRLSARDNWRLPLLNMPSTLASQAVTVLPLFAVAAHATPVETGAVAFAQRIVEPAFHLFAALATQRAIEGRFFEPHRISRADRPRFVVRYVCLGLVVAACLWGVLLIAQRFGLPGKMMAAIVMSGPVLVVALGVFASGPVLDLAQLAGHERIVLFLNFLVLTGGLTVIAIGGTATGILWMFAGLFAMRAVVIVTLWAGGRC